MDYKKVIVTILRLLLAIVFIFSGFVKAVDPWGTAIKLGEYFSAFGMGWLDWAKYALAIILSGGEMLLGFALLFRFKERITTLLVMLVMIFFTILTLIIALWEPVADCGCFGDAIKLTNWQTFYKNLILLPCAVVLWRMTRKAESERLVHPMVEGSMLFMCILFSVGVGVYSMRHLPIIDFLPFRAGVHIPTSMAAGENTGTSQAILVYRDRTTGEEHEFTLRDTEWYDTLRWEFVDTRIIEQNTHQGPSIQEFSMFRGDSNLTNEILQYPGEQFLITLSDPSLLTDRCREKLRDLILYGNKNGYPAMAVTSAVYNSDMFSVADDAQIPIYQMDGTTLKTLIRAREGVALLREGVIVKKWNCRDIPDLNEESNPILSSYLITAERERSEMRTVFVIVAFWAFVYALYFSHRKIFL